MRNNRPLRAEEICRDHLLLNPGSLEHLRVLAHALHKQKRHTEAEQQIRLALSLKPGFPQLHEDLGRVLLAQSRHTEAQETLERAIQLEPGLVTAHKLLAKAALALGQDAGADEHIQQFLAQDEHNAKLANAAEKLRAGQVDSAITELKEILRKEPDNVSAMRLLATAYWQETKNFSDAEAWLRRATSIAPDFTAAWLTLGPVLLETNKYMEAIEAYQQAIRSQPDHAAAWAGLGNAYAQASYPEKSVSAYQKSIELNPEVAGVHMGYAHVLKTLGQQEQAIKAYREAVRVRPQFGEVYWSLANLKTFRFEEHEVRAMEQQLSASTLSDSEEVHFRFALGKAYDDLKDYERAWQYYDSGNKKNRLLVSHDPLEMEIRHQDIISVFNPDFLHQHKDQGAPDHDPIFIVGLPRSGSTLIEQILASHSQVEGTSELPILPKLAASIGRFRADQEQFPQTVKALEGKDWRAYGQQYLADARRHRQTDSPYFTDKLPNNFPLVGLLHLILPNAKIINARRHPLDTCLGCYKQLFARGQNFTYDLEDLAHYYQNFDAMMQHWHTVLPGKVLDVHYEDTVIDLESQVQRILEFCGLGFEESCVRFHETQRAVKTASSEQVRRPIYQAALGQWRHYSSHLELLQEDLQEVMNKLPARIRQFNP